MKQVIRKNPLFFAFFFPALADGIFTLLGQDTSYWINKTVNEASPMYYLLLTSPWLFILGSIVWFLFWYLLFKKIREPFNLFLMFLFIIGHSWGSSSWIWREMKLNGIYTVNDQLSVMLAWCIVITYFVLISLFATYCLIIYKKRK